MMDVMTFLLPNFSDIKGPPKEDVTAGVRNLAIKSLLCADFGKPKMISSFKLGLVLLLSLSAVHVFWCYPLLPSKVSGTSDYFLILLNSCPGRTAGSEGLAFLKPMLERALMKRSFRNGVGVGMKKTSFRRAKR